MSDEQFLARWSRRKQQAKVGQTEPAPTDVAGAREPELPDRTPTEPALTEAELAELPPIESIDAATDITAFLRKGIPPALSRAALRRAWSADPAIRDFVGLAENAWDFNDPNAMPGFGPLDYSAEQIDALLRRVVGGLVQTAENLPNPDAAIAGDGARSAHSVASPAPPSTQAIGSPGEPAAAELPSASAASQPEYADDKSQLPHRTHGGALPQ
ncbi:DUF3306 domain-containing protein [Bradyrhizobium ivorense]|uniref:DUF3306 domain-containing protein n=1 Tax=Bradyrhizobium ivorense TaxID=2511166 RepID=UPI0010B24362|nr:DUF3306 domain-containing protein [Bradyrhizobium ivorense]VIO67236.1 hypothetical protein CI41S_05990 [Bradyrhizobium ivorense]